ncbi:MAG TPA: signal peptide peptidase SppA [Anaeromyxobacter sp.]|nr:signal peptide peptidase SppA [Anaeromyxobacter sp.]
MNPRPLPALLLALALPARAQLAAEDRERGLPAGLTLPVLGAAAAEEPIALDVNPAGVGFVGGFAVQYFHEGVPGRRTLGDGVYLADRLGPLALGFGHEWLRPGAAPLAKYQRSRLALALTDGRSASLGFGWTWIRSGDDALEDAGSWELGVTSRPSRFFSFAAAALGSDARLRGARLPVRFDLGVAARGWRDRLTLSADLLADDGGGRAFRPTSARFGAGVELGSGLAAALRVELPVRDGPGGDRDASGLLAVTWNAPHAGITAGALRFGERAGWIAGVRLSEERYLSGGAGRGLAAISLPRDLTPERLLFVTIGERDPYGRLVERLVAARDDPEVGALLLRIDEAPFGSGRVEELRALVAEVRARKPVLAYVTGGGTREYWLASAASAVAAPPGAPLLVNGFSSAQLYYRDLLARLGVSVQVVRAGAYKTATEPLVRSGPSPEAVQARDAILDDVYGRFVADVSAARRLDPERVRALVDQGIFTSEEARAAGLLDATPWPDEVTNWAHEVSGRKLRDAGRYRPEPLRSAQRWGRPPVIEIIRLSGIIVRGSQPGAPGRGGGAGAIAAAIHRAVEDPEVRAIVLRVDSPGGDAFASDLLWREVMLARRKGKPVVASMGDVAASGGYLVAAAADVILAEPSTLTGSIGVFAAKPDLAGLLDKLSVQRSGAGRGEKAEALSVLRPWSDAERSAVQRQVDTFYATFLDRVAEARKLPRAEVEAVASGRVWTGRQALERRLVDRLGTLADAIRLAREKAGPAAGDAVTRRADAARTLSLELPSPTRADPGAALERLARVTPEVEALLLLSDGSLGPLLALPDEWVGTAP